MHLKTNSYIQVWNLAKKIYVLCNEYQSANGHLTVERDNASWHIRKFSKCMRNSVLDILAAYSEAEKITSLKAAYFPWLAHRSLSAGDLCSSFLYLLKAGYTKHSRGSKQLKFFSSIHFIVHDFALLALWFFRYGSGLHLSCPTWSHR